MFIINVPGVMTDTYLPYIYYMHVFRIHEHGDDTDAVIGYDWLFCEYVG